MVSPGSAVDAPLFCDGDTVPAPGSFEAASPPMRQFGRLLLDAALHSVPVLLVGESGTGKTTFARALHAMSARSRGPFVRVDCPAAGGDLSAEARAAPRGTLFLDEVAELSAAAQASALRVLQEARLLSARVVASTRHDLDAEMSAGRFRRDLFYRLEVMEITVPPLRERVDDILPIARAFVTASSLDAGRPPPELSPALERALLRYAWPGNVRELLGVLERMLILCPGDRLEATELPERIGR